MGSARTDGAVWRIEYAQRPTATCKIETARYWGYSSPRCARTVKAEYRIFVMVLREHGAAQSKSFLGVVR